jgi:hypothetical protein
MCADFANNRDKRAITQYNQPLTFSLCMGVDDGMEYGYNKEDLQKAITIADEYQKQFRCIESLSLANWVLQCVSNLLKDESGMNFDSQDELLWALYHEAHFQVGFCLVELNKMQKALYYLEVAKNSYTYQHIQEYINCLCNTKSMYVLNVIEDVMKRSVMPDSEIHIEAWKRHIAFLNRRKAYVMIDMQLYKEAANLLTELLDDPNSAEFANSELEYLQANNLI